jgi:hypothetical protein
MEPKGAADQLPLFILVTILFYSELSVVVARRGHG